MGVAFTGWRNTVPVFDFKAGFFDRSLSDLEVAFLGEVLVLAGLSSISNLLPHFVHLLSALSLVARSAFVAVSFPPALRISDVKHSLHKSFPLNSHTPSFALILSLTHYR
jgi:hypothetical protein